MTTPKRIRIGTRDSTLALYQSRAVERQLHQGGIETQIIEITSQGDVDLITPLYEMGIQGIFTKSLDIALLQNKIDLAVHSCKDIPTRLAKGLMLAAVLERGSFHDCIVFKSGQKSVDFSQNCTIATSSMRRKSQWLYRYPNHETESLRGNIQTRLIKLDESDWHGAIFAQAALNRLDISSYHAVTLDWMLPSPAQGAIAIVCRSDDERVKEICKSIDHAETNVCISAERNFLAALQGGCTVPIAAHATIENEKLFFRGNIFSLDAKVKCEVEIEFDLEQASVAGAMAAERILKQGGESIVKSFQSVS